MVSATNDTDIVDTPTVFDFKGSAVRVIADVDCEPWFVAKDVCDILGLGTEHLRRDLDEDEVTEATNLPNWQVGTNTRTRPGDIRGEAGSVAWRLACIILAVLQAVAAGACLDALLGLPADASPWLSIAYAVGTVTLWLAAVGVASLAVGGNGARHGRHCDEEEDR